MPSRRAISRVEIPAENFKRMISRTWRIATLSAGIIAPLDCQRRDPKQASGGARRYSRPRAALFRSGGRHHLVMVGGIIPLRRAPSSRYDGRLEQESAHLCQVRAGFLPRTPAEFAAAAKVRRRSSRHVLGSVMLPMVRYIA